LSISALIHQFKVSSVPVSIAVPTRLNIKKRPETILYRTLSNRDNINISYVMGEQLNPIDNLCITDRSVSLVQNRIPDLGYITQLTTQTLTLNIDKFLVTDTFTVDTPTKIATPLFYMHTLSQFNPDVAGFSSLVLISLEFMNKDFQSISLTEYVLDKTLGEIYNNIENSYDVTTTEFDVTYIKYVVRNGTTTTVYHEIVNNEPIYQLATFDDIDDDGLILTGRKRYLVEELPGGSSFLVTLPSLQLYAYKELQQSRLYVIEPTALDNTDPWLARVSNGQFLSAYNSINYKYHVAEFNGQAFSPYPPYKAFTHHAVWLNSSLIHLPKNIVYDPTIGLEVEIFIYNSEHVLQSTYTTNTLKIGTTYTGDIDWEVGISSIDELNGFIELVQTVTATDIIEVSYYSIEDEYEISLIDFNPSNNTEILDKRVVFYIAPENIYTGELTKSLHYLLVNSVGKITYASQATEVLTGALDPATRKLVDEDFSTTGSPKHTFYYDKESTVSGLNSRVMSGINLPWVEEFSFIDKYTVESILFNGATPSGIDYQNYLENPRLLVLADITTGEHQSVEGLTTFECRVQGGGIKSDSVGLATEYQPQVSWMYDSTVPRPYPGVGTFYAQVPQTVLEDHGGLFTRDQVTDIIHRYTKMGGYGILDTYGVDPTITDVVTSSGQFKISWPSYGPTISYNIYYSTDIDSDFTQVNPVELSDIGLGNDYTISGLIPGVKYYTKVEAIDSADDKSTGSTISVTTLTTV
jgi:hypothetical protein